MFFVLNWLRTENCLLKRYIKIILRTKKVFGIILIKKDYKVIVNSTQELKNVVKKVLTAFPLTFLLFFLHSFALDKRQSKWFMPTLILSGISFRLQNTPRYHFWRFIFNPHQNRPGMFPSFTKNANCQATNYFIILDIFHPRCSTFRPKYQSHLRSYFWFFVLQIYLSSAKEFKVIKEKKIKLDWNGNFGKSTYL